MAARCRRCGRGQSYRRGRCAAAPASSGRRAPETGPRRRGRRAARRRPGRRGYHSRSRAGASEAWVPASLRASASRVALTCVVKILRRVRAESPRRLHAIDATPARWRGDVGSSPLDGASAAASPPRGARRKLSGAARHTRWLISTQASRTCGAAVALTIAAGPSSASSVFAAAARCGGTKRHRRRPATPHFNCADGTRRAARVRAAVTGSGCGRRPASNLLRFFVRSWRVALRGGPNPAQPVAPAL